MIGKITGFILELTQTAGLIQTQSGISFEVLMTPSHLLECKTNSEVSIYTYLQVKEDALNLFGFRTKQEKDLFKLLLSVPSVGPKTAFLIISFTNVDEAAEAIKDNKPEFFTKIPGLGKKTAYKIILELSQKLDTKFTLKSLYLSDDDKTAIDALVSLGFSTEDAKNKISTLSKSLTIEEKIKEALKAKR